ncbi:hypothetical protein GCM10027168_69270 [Streptomyces capparidis]
MKCAAAIAGGPGLWKDEQAVAVQLAHHKLTGDGLFETYAEPVHAPS